MPLSLRCACGQVEADVDAARAYARATCYCRDCRAYARWLGAPALLDAQGGTDVVAMNPGGVRVLSGADRIACMSLSGKGLLRWYAACCRTPLGNTPRDAGMAYVGIITTGLVPSGAVDEAFGPAGRTVIKVESALGMVRPTRLALMRDGLRIFGGIMLAKLRRQPPSLFFQSDGAPIRASEVLDAPACKRLYAQDESMQ